MRCVNVPIWWITLLVAALVRASLAQAPATNSAVAEQISAEEGEPDEASIQRALSALAGKDALAREAAIRRLTPHPRQAAPAVVKLFEQGNLSTRLTVMELLESWHAPIKRIDPWQGDKSITPQTLELLQNWAKDPQPLQGAPSTMPATTMPAADLTAARREIALMLGTSDPGEVRVFRERLARMGPILLSEVRAQSLTAATDQSRQRLNALRYRLVASDRLVSSWPEGIERLASIDASARHAALDELPTRATSADTDLLLELFSDADPFIREQSLRVLYTVAGNQSMAALVKLLYDPEPNVRAAVLKQLTEQPHPGLMEEISAYVANEKDPDLVVHAVRALRANSNPAAAPALMLLLQHDDWRVRAEVIEAIGEKATGHGAAGANLAVFTAMIKLLEDPDPFVVSRAVEVLTKARLATAVGPLMQAAVKHPELAAHIIEAVTADKTLGAAAVPQLNELSSHADPQVRAVAVSALATVAPQTSVDALSKALSDADASVRIAAARGAFTAIESLRPQGGYVTRSTLFGLRSAREKVDVAAWFNDFREGKTRPPWAAAIKPQLQQMIAATDPSERIAAATLMVPLGEEETAAPLLLAAAKTDPKNAAHIARSLPWLEWNKRLELFDALTPVVSSNESQLPILISQMTFVPDERAAEPVWKILANSTSPSVAGIVYQELLKLYLGQEYNNSASISDERRQAAKDAVLRVVASGTDLQRSIALCLLLSISTEDVAEHAHPIVESQAGDLLRLDALQVELISLDKAKADTLAVKYVGDPVLRKVALPYLSVGATGLRQIRGSIYLRYTPLDIFSEPSGQTIQVTPPDNLNADSLRPGLQAGDAKLAAYAGYLLVLTGDSSGMEPLISYWRQSAKNDDAWTRLVYRAIAFANDETRIPILEEIYKDYGGESYRIGNFYWTIRAMTGEKILALRQKIRDEIGMDRLR